MLPSSSLPDASSSELEIYGMPSFVQRRRFLRWKGSTDVIQGENLTYLSFAAHLRFDSSVR